MSKYEIIIERREGGKHNGSEYVLEDSTVLLNGEKVFVEKDRKVFRCEDDKYFIRQMILSMFNCFEQESHV